MTFAAIIPSSRPALEQALIERLTAESKLNAAAAERARRVAAERGERLESVIVNLGLAGEREVVAALAAVTGWPLATAEDFPEAPVAPEAVSAKFLRECGVLPLSAGEEAIHLAMLDPLNDYARRAIELATGRRVAPLLALPSELSDAFERLFDGGRQEIGQIVEEIDDSEDAGAAEDVDRLRDLASEAPVIRLVNLLIVRAIERRASDIHVEPFRNRLLVRYRIDGELHEAAEPPARLKAAVVSRIKIMARLNIAERRLPQDGRIRFTFRGRDLDLRVSTMPTLYGETIGLRILDRSSLVDDYRELGFAEDDVARLAQALAEPQGILLVTGPTGSGKTTTLYTGLLQLNRPSRKLFTVEDPIEYELEGVNQVQVKGQIGLSFAQVLRSVLRHDPDIVMVGEIRDLETAEVAVQASLTGHLVLSTLHTNDAAGSVTRLLDMGVANYLVTSTLNGALAQRLVRRLCLHCRRPRPMLPELMHQLTAAVGPEAEGGTLYQPEGCEHCHGAGFHGRLTIAELLVMNDELRRLVLAGADARSIRQAAVEGGMRTMYADGMLKALAGITTVEEVLRTTRAS